MTETERTPSQSQYDGPIEVSEFEPVRTRLCEECDTRTKHVHRDDEWRCTRDHTTTDDGQQTLIPDGGTSTSGTDHSFEVGDELEKIDSSVWKITNRMVDVDTGETLYRLRESDVGPSNFTEILTESQIERSFHTGTDSSTEGSDDV